MSRWTCPPTPRSCGSATATPSRRPPSGADAFAKAYPAFRHADARAQAKASLLEDVARLNQQIAAAEKVIRSPGPAPATARPAQARLIPLNNRLQPLNVQLNGFLSLDFAPGTVIAEAGLPSRPAPTAASNRHRPARRAVPGRRARVRP